MNRADALSMWLKSQGPWMEQQIFELAAENSFTEHREGGERVAAQLAQLFALPGLGLRRVASERFADHLVFESEGRAGAAPVMLLGHFDTVFPPGTFDGVRRDGDLLRGPGVLDMKGGLVVVAAALRALCEVDGLASAPPLRLVIVSDEEIGSPEGKAVIEHAARGAEAALVFEAGRAEDAIITRRKGTGGLKVIAEGKAAHAGAAHQSGANALWALARFIDRAQALTDYARGVTVNVGRVQGGTSKNTVPDSAVADVDLRFERSDDAQRVLAELHVLAAQASASVAGTSLRIEGGVSRVPLERTESSRALMAAYAREAAAVGLGSAEAGLIGGGSDASTTSALGIASIDGLGPRGRGFHTKDEQVERDSLVPKAQALARWLASR